MKLQRDQRWNGEGQISKFSSKRLSLPHFLPNSGRQKNHPKSW